SGIHDTARGARSAGPLGASGSGCRTNEVRLPRCRRSLHTVHGDRSGTISTTTGPGGWAMPRAMKFVVLACVSMAVAAGCVTPPPTGTPGGPVDLTAPQILTVAVAPAEVAPGQQLTVSATVTDAVGATGVTFVVRGNGMPVGWCGGAATLVGGTAQT